MTIEELKERLPAMRGMFARRGRRAGEIESIEDIRIGRVFRWRNEKTGENFIFAPRENWGRHNRHFGADYMRIKSADGTIDDLRDLDIGEEEVVVTRLA
jgi:hypothetical protein